jgi:hypothetical protein
MRCEICAHAAEHGSWPQWLLNKGGTHCGLEADACHRTWTAKREAHCVGTRIDGAPCHAHFSADSVADKHRDRGHCLTPDEMVSKQTKKGEKVFRRIVLPDGAVLWRHRETLSVKPAYLVRKGES